jgi:hypothetical protein
MRHTHGVRASTHTPTHGMRHASRMRHTSTWDEAY